MFIKKAWYVALASSDLEESPIGRTICGEAIVFFRDNNNDVHALEDFCPHRGAPLSLGRVVNDRLRCGYHGLEMGCEGKTVSMPGQRVGGFPSIKRYAAIERYGFIWVWPGDFLSSDETSMPELDWADNPSWAFGGGQYHIRCNYKLMVDNLMDLTHETYVHANSIGQPEIDETPCTTKVDGDHVITSRFMEGIDAPPFWKMALRGSGLPDHLPVDRWQVCHFSPPSHIMIEVGVALAGNGGYNAPDDKKAYSLVVDFLTPETETSMWYFWGMARKFNVTDNQLTEAIREGQGKIFSEDLGMLERQQENLLRSPERKLLNLNIDAGGVQARRVIERYLSMETVV